jgi:dCTP deaminase
MGGIKNDRWIKEMAKTSSMIEPFVEELISEGVISYGLSSYGYDFRLSDEFLVPLKRKTPFDPKSASEFKFKRAERMVIEPGWYVLGKSLEYFRIPKNVIGVCVGKSTYARSGIIINITPLEPGWEGYITIAISNISKRKVTLYAGEGIAQVLFFEGEEPLVSYADRKGKYHKSKEIKPPLIKK